MVLGGVSDGAHSLTHALWEGCTIKNLAD